MGKPEWIKNCSQLAEHSISCVFQQYSNSSEVHLIFKRYDLPLSLKSAKRDRRQGGQQPVFYHITDTTNISKAPLKRLLFHVKTEMELTNYLAENIVVKAREQLQNMVVAWGCNCIATHKEESHLKSNHEEADTKLLLHVIHATASGATKIRI